MLQEQEANQLIVNLIALRKKYAETNALLDLKELKKHETICANKFSYIIHIHTAKYKNFSNYEDLLQEGYVALINALSNINPNKGNVFFWLHKYTSTRISRCANLHTTIRYPLKVAKEIPPHKENVMPVMLEEKLIPELEVETAEVSHLIANIIEELQPQEQEVIKLYFGFEGLKKLSVNKICKELKISRKRCLELINSGVEYLKNNIEL